MKILWVKADLLHPLDRGATIRSYNMLRHLKLDHDITYLALASESERDATNLAHEYCDRIITVPWAGAPSRTNWRFYLQALRNLASDLPLPLERYQRPALGSALRGLLANDTYDVAVCDFLFPALQFTRIRGTATLLFQHNIEALIWKRYAQERRPIARSYFKAQARRMRQWEGRLAARFDHVATVSEEDARLMREWYHLDNVTAIPTGVDVRHFHPAPPGTVERDVVFVGSLDWLPNIDAVRWMLTNVWPTVREENSAVKVHIVGRRPAPSIKQLIRKTPGAVLWPDVPDVRKYLWEAAVVVVPLRVGGGTRLKIFEALACGKAIVATPVGAEGLPVIPDRHVCLESEPSGFAEALLALLNDPQRRRQLGAAGRDLVRREFSWEYVACQFSNICESLIVDRQTTSPTP